ncbi:retrovirus-related pol polyprotein from transposon TNT 1-94 [Tanacetum coccineum]
MIIKKDFEVVKAKVERKCLALKAKKESSDESVDFRKVKANEYAIGEPKNVNEALTDDSWIVAMQEELNQFIANDVWELVAQGYNKQKGIDYDEAYAPVARLDSIKILLAYAYALDFKLFQMDLKSAFLNGFINEENRTISIKTVLSVRHTIADILTKTLKRESFNYLRLGLGMMEHVGNYGLLQLSVADST